MADSTHQLDPSNSMYQPFQYKPPTQQYSIGNGDFTTDPNSPLIKNAASGGGSVPGVGMVNNPGAYSSTPNSQSGVPAMSGLTPVVAAPASAQQTPVVPQATPNLPLPTATQPIDQGPQTSQVIPQTSAEQIGQKYSQGFAQSQNSSTPAPQSSSEGRAMVNNTNSNYQAPQAPQAPYQPTQQFMQVGDPIMQSFIQSAMSYQNDTIQTGYTAKALQASFANQLQGIDLQAANIQNIMNGTRDDIRAEIGKAGGFATESQVEGLVTTRNRDLLKQYNNIELQKQTMQNQMQMQVSLAQADHQYAVDKYDQVLKTTNLYKGIYDNTTDQVDKLVQNVGYTGLAQAYGNDPYALSMVEQHLKMPEGTLSDPQALQSLDTYRQQSIAMSNQRLGMSQQRLNIYVGNNTPNQAAINGELQSYKTTGQIPPLKNQAQANAFWQAAGSDPNIIGDANASKAITAAGKKSLGIQQTQYNAIQTSLGTFDKQMNLVESNLQKVDKSGVPLINRYKNFVAGNYTGDPEVTALNNSIQTASSEFAKILSGSSASISGTTVDSQHAAASLINQNMNAGQLESVIAQMRKEGQYRLQTQGDIINEIQKGLKTVGQGGGSAQGSTQVMVDSAGKKWNIPVDKVDLYKQHGFN